MKDLKLNYTVEVGSKLTTLFIYLMFSFSESESESWFDGFQKSKFSCHVFSSWRFRVRRRCSQAVQSEIIEVFNERTTM